MLLQFFTIAAFVLGAQFVAGLSLGTPIFEQLLSQADPTFAALQLPIDTDFGETLVTFDPSTSGLSQPFNAIVGGDGGNGTLFFLEIRPDGTLGATFRLDANSAGIPEWSLGLDVGQSVCVLGDVTLDGIIDIAVGVPANDGDNGGVYLLELNATLGVISFTLINGSSLTTTTPLTTFGESLACPGDYNNDGSIDLFVGAPDIPPGAVHILSLTPALTLAAVDVLIAPGMGAFDAENLVAFGDSIAAIGDMDLNGIIDIAVGDSNFEGGSGAVFIILLNASGQVLAYSQLSQEEGSLSVSLVSGAEFGVSVAGPGDLDGDGIPDLIVGAPDFPPAGAGAAYVITLNADGTARATFQVDSQYLTSFAATSNFGTSLALFSPSQQFPTLLVCGEAVDNIGGIATFQFTFCGNSIIEGTETCDSGLTDTPGCTNCQIGIGYACTGQPSICTPVCGDSIVIAPEQCDDGNVISGDGCTSACVIESGYFCTSTSVCVTVCGDGQVVGDEGCDDGNLNSSDGCSASCVDENSLIFSDGAAAGVAVGVFGLFLIVIVCIAFGVYVTVKTRKRSTQINLSLISNVPVLKDIEVGHQIGSGAGGIVFYGKWNTTEVALKTIRTDRITEFESELKILNQGRHPALIAFYGLFEYNENVYMVTEYMNRGDLSGVLAKEYELTVSDFVSFAYTISTGVEYLHEQKIVHRDLAARNILVSQDRDLFAVKVSDFGMSKQVEDFYAVTKQVPIRWTAPEVFLYQKFTYPSDVWAFAITIWEIFSRGVIP